KLKLLSSLSCLAGYTLAMATSDEQPTGGAAEMSMKHPFISWSAVAVIFLLLRLMGGTDWKWKTGVEIGEMIKFNDAICIVVGTLWLWQHAMSTQPAVQLK